MLFSTIVVLLAVGNSDGAALDRDSKMVIDAKMGIASVVQP